MLTITSLNLNGIRSATSKGLEAWLATAKPNLLCVQEVKAQHDDVKDRFEELAGMRGYFHYAQKKGYSGVGVYGREAPSDVITGFGSTEFDAEGRYVEVRFDAPGRRFSVISCYFPSGSSGEDRQAAKYRFLDEVEPHLLALKSRREFVLCGDINIAHKQQDLKNWRGNQKNSGFLPQERAWMTRLLDEHRVVDVYRQLKPDTTDDCYTWWSNRGNAYANNVGWRLDYHLATAGVAQAARNEAIYRKQKFSDHAPITVQYDMTL